MLQLTDEVGGCAALEPVVVQFPVDERVQQTERIEDILRAGGEAVTVVHEFYLPVHLVRSQFIDLSHLFQVLGEDILYLVFRESADGGETRVERHVLDVVYCGENTELRELGDSGDEAELNILLIGFKRLVEFLHYSPHTVQPGVIVEYVKQRSIVFVDDDNHLAACVVIKATDHAVQYLSGSNLHRIRLITVEP